MRFSYSFIGNSVVSSLVASALLVALVMVSFFALEPVVTRAQLDEANETFNVNQTITAEISFAASTTDVTMSPNLNGLTGGYSTGTAVARVLTNNTSGYNMTIIFSGTDAMQGIANGGSIADYTLGSATTAPDYQFSIGGAGTQGEFAYTILASTTADVDGSFLDNNTNCDVTGGTYEVNKCWMTPSTTAFQIIDRSTATPLSGATTSVRFKVAIPTNPNPAIPNDTYRATVTLTATVNP